MPFALVSKPKRAPMAAAARKRASAAISPGCLETLPVLQTKLEVGDPNDRFEQEADRVAEEIMRMPEREASGTSKSPARIQKNCCEGVAVSCPAGAEKIHRKPLPSIQLQPAEKGPFAPQRGVGLVQEINEAVEEEESAKRLRQKPDEYDPNYVPWVRTRFAEEKYLFNFAVSGVDLPCQELKTIACTANVIKASAGLAVNVSSRKQVLNGQSFDSVLAVEVTAFPVFSTVFLPKESPNQEDLNHELHHLRDAFDTFQAFKTRLSRNIRARVIENRRKAAADPKKQADFLSQDAILKIAVEEADPFVRSFDPHLKLLEDSAHQLGEGELSKPLDHLWKGFKMPPLKRGTVGSFGQPVGEKTSIQPKRARGHEPGLTPDVQAGLHGLRGGGQALPDSVRRFFESRFGDDFNRVRLHTGAAGLADALGARALTMGEDVVFARGEYAPDTVAGKKLLAHELTHVLQQRGGKTPAPSVQRFSKQACETTCKDECGHIEKELRLARQCVETAIAAMKEQELSAQTRTAMRWLFSLEDDSRNGYIVKVLETMRQALVGTYDQTDIQCGQDCPANSMAKVETPKVITPGVLQQCTTDIPCTITICPSYFDLSAGEQRAISLVHESGHLAGLAGDVYNVEPKFRLLSRDEALNNADHFALFVRALNGTLKSDLRTSGGAIGGLGFAGGKTGWFFTGLFDLTLNRPVFRIYNPVLRLSITGYGVPGSGRGDRLEQSNDTAVVASLLGGLRVGSSRGPGGWFGDVLVGGGEALRGQESSLVFSASASLGFRWQRTEFSLGASYIRDTTAAKEFQQVFLVGASANFNFFDLVGKY